MAKSKTNLLDIEITTDILTAYQEAKEAKRQYDALDKLLKAHLKASETETLLVDGKIVSLKKTTKHVLDQKAFAAFWGEALEEFKVDKIYESVEIH